MMEEWRDIPGFEGRFQASSEGRIRSLDRLSKTGKQLVGRAKKLTLRKSTGYYNCHIEGKTFLVHNLVALAFLGQKPNGMVVRHLDGNPSNNRMKNLEYGTVRENVNDKKIHGTISMQKKLHIKYTGMIEEPEWKQYRNTNYFASKAGVVVNKKTKRVLGFESGGYMCANIIINNKAIFTGIHRMVLEAHSPVENCDRLVVRHLDGNKKNNSIDNLSWGTHSENSKDEVSSKRNFNTKRTHCVQGHPLVTRESFSRHCPICARICLWANRRAGAGSLTRKDLENYKRELEEERFGERISTKLSKREELILEKMNGKSRKT